MERTMEFQEISPAEAIAKAEYFSVCLFRGVGAYDRGACDSLSAARDMGERMEKAAGNGKGALIYAILPTGSGVLVPRDFVL